MLGPLSLFLRTAKQHVTDSQDRHGEACLQSQHWDVEAGGLRLQIQPRLHSKIVSQNQEFGPDMVTHAFKYQHSGGQGSL